MCSHHMSRFFGVMLTLLLIHGCDDVIEPVGDGDSDEGVQLRKKADFKKCGNGTIDEKKGEECDDGNADNTDACTNACKDAVCGDGFVWTDEEECDDGNMVNGDGCTADCQKELFCHAIGYDACPSGATQFCIGEPIVATDSDHAKAACETCYGMPCFLETADCAGPGWGPQPPGEFVCNDAYFGFTDGCSGGPGRVWAICNSFLTYGMWAG